MTKEVSKLLKQMDIRVLDTQIAFRCAPLIAGLKISNLLIVENGQANEVMQLLQHTKFGGFLLYQGVERTMLLLYVGNRLEAYLKETEVKKMLWQKGYKDFPLLDLLDAFAARYVMYRKGFCSFPHEMGLFLGYPFEDVRGFMENNGKNALCAGYWKVYENASEKVHVFRQFDRAVELLLRLVAEGYRMADMLKYA